MLSKMEQQQGLETMRLEHQVRSFINTYSTNTLIMIILGQNTPTKRSDNQGLEMHRLEPRYLMFMEQGSGRWP